MEGTSRLRGLRSGSCQAVLLLLAPLWEASPWHLCLCVAEIWIPLCAAMRLLPAPARAACRACRRTSCRVCAYPRPPALPGSLPICMAFGPAVFTSAPESESTSGMAALDPDSFARVAEQTAPLRTCQVPAAVLAPAFPTT